ncbi:MAG: cation-translocating P-type ATPase [Verrucomicrobia bacterium]|nr:cation-translocating P-type ATPase [Verrucomicrobiota bacterium]
MIDEQPQITNLTPRFWATCLFAMPLWLRALNPWLQFVFATLVLLIGAKPFLQRGFTNICNRFTPIALAISIAYVYSFFALLLREKFLYFKQLATIMPILLLWQGCERALIEMAHLSIQRFLNFFPQKASKMFADGHVEVVPVERFVEGDFVQLKPGETIPVDGMIFSNSAEILESLQPANGPLQKKRFGERVLGGWKNGQELSIVQATEVGSGTVYARLRDALLESLPVAVKEYSCSIFIVAVVLVAFIAFLFWSLTSGFERAIGLFCTVLMTMSTSTWALSRSVVLRKAIGIGIWHGIVINAANNFEQLYKVDAQSTAPRDLNSAKQRIVGQNTFIAVLCNAILIPMALSGSITLISGTLWMVITSLCVVVNSLRLK